MTVTALGAQAAVASKGILGAAVSVAIIVTLLAVTMTVRQRRAGRAAGRAEAPAAEGPDSAELAAAASSALRQADDAVLTSEQELGFAIAVFGERAMEPFSAAVENARAERREAFRLWQRVGDDPVGPTGAQPPLTDIIQRCSAASRTLDEQADAFDKARRADARAPHLVAEVDAQIAQQSARVSQAREVLSRLATKYTPGAIVTVATNPDHAAARLEFATDCLASAAAASATSQAGTAAVLLQAAEAGADQAADLLTGVLHMEAELTQAASAVPAALREIDAEMAEATAHLASAPDDERSALVAVAQAVSDDVRAKLAAGAFDALVALRDLQEADAALDRALAGVRTQQARRQRAIAVLDEAMLVARSSVTAAEDFITTRRGGIGSAARTKLAEASRLFQEAIGVGQSDPEAALGAAQDADALAQAARALAEQDVASLDDGAPSTEPRLAWPGWASAGGAGLRGAILGGILIQSRNGDIGPGSFGGVGTRGRHTFEPLAWRRTGQAEVTDEASVANEASVAG